MSKSLIEEAAKQLLEAVKNQDVLIFKESEDTPDYIQNLEDALSQQLPVKGVDAEDIVEILLHFCNDKNEIDLNRENFKEVSEHILPHLRQSGEQQSEVDNLKAELKNSEGAHDITLQSLIDSRGKFSDELLAELEKIGIDTSDCDGDDGDEIIIIARWIKQKIDEATEFKNYKGINQDKK